MIKLNRGKPAAPPVAAPTPEPAPSTLPTIDDFSPVKVEEPAIEVAAPVPKLSMKLAKKIVQSTEQAMAEHEEARENVLAGFNATLAPEVYEVPGFNAEEFEGALTVVHQGLLEKRSDMGDFVLGIFKNLNRYPEVSTVLTEEQIGVVVGGLLSVKKVELSTTKPKKPKTPTQFEGMSNNDVLNMEF
jgi:hypothetical protein